MDLVFCHDGAGIEFAQSLDHPASIDKFALHLPETFCGSYHNRGLIIDEEQNFEQFRIFVVRALHVFERNSEIWALPTTNTQRRVNTITDLMYLTLNKHRLQSQLFVLPKINNTRTYRDRKITALLCVRFAVDTDAIYGDVRILHD